MNEEIIEVMRRYEEPCMTLPEIAEEMGRSKSGVQKRMGELVDEGKVMRKTVGANAVVWWLPERMKGPQSGEMSL